MSFLIAGTLVEPDGCRIPSHRLNVIDVASGRVLASTEVAEGPKAEFRLEYDRQPDEPHEVLLVASDDELDEVRTAAANVREGRSIGVEARIGASDWVAEGPGFVARPL